MNEEWRKSSTPHIDELPHKGDTVIGNEVWIAHNAVILPGVHIGDGAIIGAYSVVAKDIPPYAIAVGIQHELLNLNLMMKWLICY